MAIKEFRQPKNNGSVGLSRLCLREASHLSLVRHPNVVALLGVWPAKNSLLLELVEGQTLAERLKRGPVEPNETLGVSKCVSLALNYLHNLSPEAVIHLDIKSANVLLPSKSAATAKLCDFGSARLLPKHACGEFLLGGVSGTPAWMAPEVVEQRPVGRPADVYSLGVVFWEMITARRDTNLTQSYSQ